MMFVKRSHKLWIVLFLAGFILIATITSGYAAAPGLNPGTYVQDGGSDLDTVDMSAPVIFDWDNDGDKDILTQSTFYNPAHVGYIEFYENVNPSASSTVRNANPIFSGAVYLQSCNNDGSNCSDIVTGVS